MSTTSVTTTSKVVLKRKKSTLSEAKIAVLGDKNVGKSGKFYFLMFQKPHV